MKLFTIGFTRTSAENFFTRLKESGAKSLVDVRLNNVSQLSGFAKRDDLRYFTRAICGIPYTHDLKFAPTQEMLDAYRKSAGSWGDYENRFINLISERHIEDIDRTSMDGACLLCSEGPPHNCHRRLVAEYLRDKWGNMEIIHL